MGFIKSFKKTLCVILSTLLLTVSCTVFLGCNNTQNPPYKGLPLENQTEITPYSQQTKTFATETIKELLINIYKSTVNNNVSANTLNLLSTHANEISKITENQSVTEKTYKAVFENISINSENYARAIANVRANKPESQDVADLRKLLGLLSSSFGADVTATIIYQICDYYYGYLYEKNLKEYQDYGWQYKLDDAQKALADRKTLTEDITLTNFIPSVKLAFFFGEIVMGGAESSSAIENLTASEIALMLKTPDFSNINMSVNGWKLVLTFTSKLFLDNVYKTQLFKRFTSNGDLDNIASKMNDFIALFTTIQSRITETHANYLRQGNTNGFIAETFKTFTNEDWLAFESLTAFNFDTDYYNDYAIQFYGTKYVTYYNSITKVNVNTLMGSVDSQNFTKLLKNYFAGIFPACLYGVEL